MKFLAPLTILFFALLATTVHAVPITFTYDAAGNLTESSAPGPLLDAAKSGSQRTFSWTSLASGWTLLSTPSLTLPITWTPVGATPATVGRQNVVTVSAPGATLFYILRK